MTPDPVVYEAQVAWCELMFAISELKCAAMPELMEFTPPDSDQ